MQKTSALYIVLLLIIMTFVVQKSHAIDIVKLQNQQMSENKAAHNSEVVRRALEVTVDEFGPFEFKVINLTMSNSRLHKSAVDGRIFNTVIVLSNKPWDESTIAIKVPVRLGLLSYRVLLINKVDLPKFAKVKTLTDLQAFSAGLTVGWETTKIYKYHDLNMVETGHFEGIFLMLDKHRFNYIPRGVYEVYDELRSRRSSLKNVVVEPSIVLNIPTTTNVYVSPKYPRIAKRLEAGLNKLMTSGELREILYKYYAHDIQRANLKDRNIIKIDNPYYDPAYDLNFNEFLTDF